jgi:hypothetical protein
MFLANCGAKIEIIRKIMIIQEEHVRVNFFAGKRTSSAREPEPLTFNYPFRLQRIFLLDLI